MKIDTALVKLLMEMGFLSTNTGHLIEAERIFDAVARARPTSGYPRIGLGCVAIGYGNFAEAVEILRKAPADDRQERELCQGFLGLALKLGGDEDECRNILTQLQEEGENEVAVLMAGKLLAKM